MANGIGSKKDVIDGRTIRRANTLMEAIPLVLARAKDIGDKRPDSELMKFAESLWNVRCNKSKGTPVVKPVAKVAEVTSAVVVPRTVISLAQLKDAQSYSGMAAVDLAEVVKVIQVVIEEKAKADKMDKICSDWFKGAMDSPKKLGITPEELKKRFSELDQFDAANK